MVQFGKVVISKLARVKIALEIVLKVYLVNQGVNNVCAYTTYAMIEPSRWDNQEASI